MLKFFLLVHGQPTYRNLLVRLVNGTSRASRAWYFHTPGTEYRCFFEGMKIYRRVILHLPMHNRMT